MQANGSGRFVPLVTPGSQREILVDFDESGSDEDEIRQRHHHVEHDGETVFYRSANREESVKMRNTDKDKPGAELPYDKALRVAGIALLAAMGSFLFGLDIGYIGPIVASDSFVQDVAGLGPGEKLSGGQEGLIVSLFSIGAIVTACPLISSYFMNAWGRRDTIILGSVVFIVGSGIQAVASNMTTMFIGRFVAGMSIGLLSSCIVLYQMELAPAYLRGALGTLYQLMITFGILIAAIIDQALVDKPNGWRIVIWIMCAPAAILCIGLLFMPRSPRWLMSQDRQEEALKVLMSVRAEAEAHQELGEIARDLERARQEGEAAWGELFHVRGARGRIGRLVLLGVSLQLIQQLVGMNAFMYFGPDIFESMGFSKNLFTTINNTVNFVSTFPAVFLADISGRKKLMLFSSTCMAIACAIMGIMGLIYVEPAGEGKYTISNKSAGWVIALSVFFFVFNFAYGFGPIVWVYVGEIFSTKYRARAVGLCTMANWVGNFVIAQFTPMLLEAVQFSTFFIFGIFCIIGSCVVCNIPETKGVPLEAIEVLFDKTRGFRSSAQKEKGEDVDSTDEDSN
eukprot:TRINITY_DN106739_c0_g1_i1.p1 TRINITY_DN106739_c0_g1~~TRINITY_DN106739_c0_g1_i1.p1  ORF type:complete len:591 (+),score=126.99 TRINITY_DN106739_c0_g1_i1:72-1775(+)